MDTNVFARRRKEFMEQMGGGVAVFSAAPMRSRNGDVDYKYRQDSDFYYLTGFEEPEAVCILAPGNPKHEFVMLVRPRDKEQESWNGYRAGMEGAIVKYGAELAHPIQQIQDILPSFLENAPALYYRLNRDPEMDRKLFSCLEAVRMRQRHGVHPPPQIIDPAGILAPMRLIKRPEEVAALQQAADISARAHVAAMKYTRPGIHEYEVQAIIEYVFRSSGSARNGYPSIVGSGPHTCILHYIENRRQMQDGDLLLVDAGAEYEYYTGDITRTYPVSGRFSEEQKAVYEVVLEAQKKGIDAAKANASFASVHAIALHSLTRGMIDLGLLSGTVDENIESEAYSKYYFHRTSHWLGMDVHDSGKYCVGNAWTSLAPGMVLTVEPGIYISGEDEHEKFRNIGIRIEDDVLVTENGPRILTADCPKEIADLEAIIGTGPQSLI